MVSAMLNVLCWSDQLTSVRILLQVLLAWRWWVVVFESFVLVFLHSSAVRCVYSAKIPQDGRLAYVLALPELPWMLLTVALGGKW